MSVDIESYNVEELTESLIHTLTFQESNMAVLKKHLDEQLHAVRTQERSTIEHLTAETSTVVNTLQRLQHEKENYMQLLFKALNIENAPLSVENVIELLEKTDSNQEQVSALKQLFERIPNEAKAIRESSKELAYSLQYALHLGHQMIEAIQGAISFPPVLIYTAEGNKKLSASKRMMVNKVG